MRTLLLILILSGCAPGSSRDTAKARLAHPDPQERMAALGEMDVEPRLLDRAALLRTALSDGDARVRRSAALLLEERTGAPLEQTALEALAGERPDAGVAESLLSDSREALRTAAADALSRLATPRAWALLADRMSDEPSEGVRTIAAQAVARGAARGAGAFHGRLLDALRRGLGDPNATVRMTCARALGASGERAAAPCLAGALAGAGPSERGELVALLRTATGEDLDEAGWAAKYGSAR